MIDLGRYLPPEVGTLSNFLGTVPITIGRPYSPVEISAAIAEYTTGFRSLTGYGLSYAARLASRPRVTCVWKPEGPGARVVVSDHANMPASQKVAWSPSTSPHVFVRRLPVGFANQISLAINRVQSELHLTASYYDSVFDKIKLQNVLDSIVAADTLFPLDRR